MQGTSVATLTLGNATPTAKHLVIIVVFLAIVNVIVLVVVIVAVVFVNDVVVIVTVVFLGLLAGMPENR